MLGNIIFAIFNGVVGIMGHSAWFVTMAAYTFYKVILSTINVIRVLRQNSPLLTVIRRIGHIDALVSLLTLQTAMFASFAFDKEEFVKLLNGVTGGVICLTVLFMGIQGLYLSGKMKEEEYD